jgi:hypothetical protein
MALSRKIGSGMHHIDTGRFRKRSEAVQRIHAGETGVILLLPQRGQMLFNVLESRGINPFA